MLGKIELDKYGGTFHSDVEILGTEVPLRASFSYEPEERASIWGEKPEPGCPEDVEVNKVEIFVNQKWVEIGNLEMCENLRESILDELHDMQRDQYADYSDYVYENMKDRRYA